MNLDQPESTNVQWTDSHCHLDAETLFPNLSQIVNAADELGVKRFIIPGVTPDKSFQLTRWIKHFPSIWFTVGCHPWFLDQTTPFEIDQQLTEFLKMFEGHSRLIGIGEIGLDTGIDRTLSEQIECLEVQLSVAHAYKLPVVLHARRTYQELLDTVQFSNFQQGGVVHAFSGSIQQGEAFIDLGFKLGIGGAMTWPNARRLRNVLKHLPVESFVLETDAPGMKPEWSDSEAPNVPANVPKIAKFLANLKEISLEELASITEANVNQVFNFQVEGQIYDGASQ